MSGGKGSQQTGSSTSSAESRAGAAQFPFYQAGLQNAGRIYGDDTTYPNYAPPNPYQTTGYNDLANRGYAIDANLLPPTNDAYGRLISGGGTSPAYGGYAELAGGRAGPQQTLDNVVNYGVNSALNFANPMAGYANKAAGGNLGQDQLAAVAQGKYTDAASNPYLRDMVNAALRPVSENYQTSTAPTLDARFSAGGRYGSGAADVAAGRARDAFAGNLGEISTGMYGNEYRFERGQQDTAAKAYDDARRAGLGLGITGLGAAGNLVDQGLRTVAAAATPNLTAQGTGLAGLDTGFTRSLDAARAALGQYPQFAQAQFIQPRSEIEAGTGLQTLQQQAYNAPFERLRSYMQTIGAPSGGASSTQPIFGNPLTSALSGATGILGLGKELGLGSGLNSLFGGSAAIPGLSSAASAGVGALFPAATQTAAGLAGYAALPEIASSAAAFAPAAAAWIVCTELMKQGRMPKRHYLAGWPVFAAYPERGRRGYYLWAIPLVRHLRKKPDSLLSRAAAAAFRWRAEDIAGRAGVKGARKLWRGRAVTAVLYPVCATLGWFVPPQDWSAVYRDEQAG